MQNRRDYYRARLEMLEAKNEYDNYVDDNKFVKKRPMFEKLGLVEYEEEPLEQNEEVPNWNYINDSEKEVDIPTLNELIEEKGEDFLKHAEEEKEIAGDPQPVETIDIPEETKAMNTEELKNMCEKLEEDDSPITNKIASVFSFFKRII